MTRFPRDRADLADTMTTPAECDGWIAECRRRGDDDGVALGVARKTRIQKGTK